MSKSAFAPVLMLAGLVACAALAGCKETDPAPADTDAGVTLDLGAIDVDAGAGLSCQANVPVEPFGTQVGRKLRPLTLGKCDGTPYSIYSDDFCSPTRFTVLGIAAGWCVPCQYESAMLPALQAEYEPQGVRIIQVMFQDADYNAASNEYCQAWVDNYSLTNVELNDPTQLTQVYFPMGALPATLIIDDTGTIVYREYGASSMLSSLRTKLDELLAAP